MLIRVRRSLSQGILKAVKYRIFACIASSKLCLAIETQWNTSSTLKMAHTERDSDSSNEKNDNTPLTKQDLKEFTQGLFRK